MAVVPSIDIRVLRLLRFRLCSAQAKPLADFYESALGFRRVAMEHLSGAQVEALFPGGGRVLRITLELGAQHIELIQFVDRPGRPYPADACSSDLVFQHFAIVVSDMNAAMQRLSAGSGWSPITVDGPQRLPKSSGSVTAFKFRDPEGHPLELLAFSSDGTPKHWQRKDANSLFLGIDHSAISVADSACSVAFYAALGMSIRATSTNDDPAQARLDQIDKPLVEVTAMIAGDATPHLELLDYRNSGERYTLDLRANDVAATCLVFEAEERSQNLRHNDHAGVRNFVDPDGHHLSVVSFTN